MNFVGSMPGGRVEEVQRTQQKFRTTRTTALRARKGTKAVSTTASHKGNDRCMNLSTMRRCDRDLDLVSISWRMVLSGEEGGGGTVPMVVFLVAGVSFKSACCTLD